MGGVYGYSEIEVCVKGFLFTCEKAWDVQVVEQKVFCDKAEFTLRILAEESLDKMCYFLVSVDWLDNDNYIVVLKVNKKKWDAEHFKKRVHITGGAGLFGVLYYKIGEVARQVSRDGLCYSVI